ncbi:MAG: MlaD family protein [Methylovulum sp.]|uniref:MlaD family protein n=1 Tax=Methylovulum sp. TaxID=1916980 RepID=UPI002621DFE9|nr:MlaD family protein [Methylovulum sp.]MDD2724609.1 MlaD family protein [Methylovulum sp.]MDD5123364.1 MlaD family protein [Methylovulum sp.]
MSKAVNPFSIGAFLVGSLALLVAAVLIFGGGQLFEKKTEYVVYFDSALNGLNVGAPVTLQGVQIGRVKEISLEMNEKSLQIAKPVVIEIDPERVLDTSGDSYPSVTGLQENRQRTKRLIDAGLKAQLKTQSLLTGLLYVEFNFYRNQALKLTGLNYKGLMELPSVPTTEDQIRNTADEILTKFRQLPLEAIVNDLSATLKAVRDLVTSDDLTKSRVALAKTLNETEKLVANMNHDLVPLLKNMNATVLDSQALVQQFTRDIKPVLLATEKTLNTANSVLLESKQSLNSVETLAAPDAPLWQSLDALRDAAQSTKELTDYLQRHPDSLIYGKE